MIKHSLLLDLFKVADGSPPSQSSWEHGETPAIVMNYIV